MQTEYCLMRPQKRGAGGLWFSVVLLLLAALLFILRGMGPDGDGDGMSDVYESLLGLDSGHAASSAGVGADSRVPRKSEQ